MKQLIFKAFIAFFIFLSSGIALTQEYVKVTASATKKEYQISEKIRINLKASIQDGFHINANKISDEDLIPTSVKLEGSDFKLTGVSWPTPKNYKFAFSETELQVYEGSITIGLNLKAGKNLKPGNYDISGAVHYQACNDRSCFAPRDAEFTVSITLKEDSVKTADTLKPEEKKDTTEKTDTSGTGSKSDTSKTKTTLTENKRDSTQIVSSAKDSELAVYLKEHGLFLTLILVFIGGLALNLTPCIYPLIPITISYFGAQVSGNKGQKIIMSVVYVLGMSVTYSVLGVIAALTGGLFGGMLQNPIVVGILVLIFLALALSMFGLYEIRIPQSIATFSGKSRQGYIGTAMMGLTVGFIAAPCIGPFVLSLLVLVGQMRDIFLGFLLFFVLSMGLGFPFLFLAFFSGSISKLPRSGEWMEGVKTIFGFIMVGLAVYTAQPLMPEKLYEIVFPVYLILAGAYLILIDRKAVNTPTYTRIKYLIAIASIVWGSMGLNFGHENIQAGKVEWQNFTRLSQIDSSINSAGKPTMIDFYADWCAQCKELDKITYIDPKVIEKSKEFNNIKVDLTKENEEITKRFNILGLPVVAFIGKDGKEKSELRVTGFLKPAEFEKLMDKAIKE